MDEKTSEWIADCQLYDYTIINDFYIIGRYDVIFGSRIRGGYIHDGSCDFDICCGTSEEMLTLVKDVYEKQIRKNILEQRHPANELRGMSKIKPIHKDLEWMQWLAKFKETSDIN
jgi:hypothetical protein